MFDRQLQVATIGAMVELQYEILIAKLKRPARCTDLSLIRKIFIGNDSSKASLSILSLQSQVVRDTLLLKNTAYSQNLCITSVTANTAGVVGIRANGFTTPRSRGRSAIYHMAPSLVAPHVVLITGLLYLSRSGSMIDILALNSLPISNNQGHINSSDFVGNCDTLQSGTAEAVICNSNVAYIVLILFTAWAMIRHGCGED
ncbi:hypothetical protein P3S68_007368 [Capsicum galapagoense]